MSQNATIMDYEVDDAGNIYEPNGKIVESAFISPALTKLLRDKNLVKKRFLFENVGSADVVEIECVDDNSIQEFIEILESELIKIMTSDEACSIKEIVVKDDFEFLVRELRTVSNLYHLAKLKRDNFFIATRLCN